ncbi:BMP family ABC transporter substrate-binding protein [Desulfovibrio inopinatus]|uniref:BMP family ABC transporter substrate-binding protein n=1 Tax=Desulfovibrio inopinatus TaxID=102109 RepID=UPI0003F838F6|nr:BMP family ABC transporter substrate-binding protein [Desulfovibrio inopinatus]
MPRLIRYTVLALVLLGLAAGPACAEKLKVAFIFLSTINDMGWTQAHYDGMKYAQEKLGDKIEVSYTENIKAPDAERVIRDYASQGYQLIFGTTFEYMDPMLLVAKDFPKVAFEHCSGYKTGPNMGNYFARMVQGEYLAGYMAGLMGYKNVGTVATNPIPEPIRGINAFTHGLLTGLQEAGVEHGEDVNTVVWLKAWRDPINETTLSDTLSKRGHDLIRQMADTPDSSIAACNNNVPAIGYGTNATAFGAKCALVSTMWNWGPYYVDTIQQVIDGKWKPREYYEGFNKNMIQLSPFSEAVPAAVQDKVMKKLEMIQQGDDMSLEGPIADQSGKVMIPEGSRPNVPELMTMQWLAQGVKGTLPQ